jgi:hypothetical protein
MLLMATSASIHAALLVLVLMLLLRLLFEYHRGQSHGSLPGPCAGHRADF